MELIIHTYMTEWVQKWASAFVKYCST